MLHRRLDSVPRAGSVSRSAAISSRFPKSPLIFCSDFVEYYFSSPLFIFWPVAPHDLGMRRSSSSAVLAAAKRRRSPGSRAFLQTAGPVKQL